MNVALRSVYIGAAVLAAIALIIGTYEHFILADEQRNLVVDILLPLGMFVVVLLLYRRRKGEFEETG